jgi:hypothetical protein
VCVCVCVCVHMCVWQGYVVSCVKECVGSHVFALSCVAGVMRCVPVAFDKDGKSVQKRRKRKCRRQGRLQ